MELTDHHTFRAVDDERSSLGHQRQFADIHLLLPHVEHLFLRPLVFLIEDHEADAKLEGNGVGHSLFKAFPNIIFWRTQ